MSLTGATTLEHDSSGAGTPGLGSLLTGCSLWLRQVVSGCDGAMAIQEPPFRSAVTQGVTGVSPQLMSPCLDLHPKNSQRGREE